MIRNITLFAGFIVLVSPDAYRISQSEPAAVRPEPRDAAWGSDMRPRAADVSAVRDRSYPTPRCR